MKYSSSLLIAAFTATNVFAHGVIDSVQGANGVDMPGLSVADGTPRDCASPACGSEADTSIIRNRELGSKKATGLGRTQGGGPVDASKMVAMFMGGGGGGNSTSTKKAREVHAANLLRRSLGVRAANGGTKTPKGTVETGVKAAAGAGAGSGMPTCADDGTVKMTFHQVNQDGAGPLKAMADGTSGGMDPKAFKAATVTKNVPGIGIGGLSAAAVMDFPVEAKMPEGMTCDATVGGVDNVCVMKLQNSAAAGPFGGSVAFTQSAKAKRRAIEYNLRKRNFARALINKRRPDAVSDALAALTAVGSATTAEDGGEEKTLTKRQKDEAAAALEALKAMGSATGPEDEEDAENLDKETAAEDKEKRELSARAKQNKNDDEREQAEIDREIEEEDRDIAAEDKQKRASSKDADREQAEIDREIEEEDRDIAAEDKQKRASSKDADREQAEIDREIEEEDRE